MPTLSDMWKRVQAEGPSHILLDKNGTVEMTVIVKQKNPDVTWDVIYFRADGYTLGCDIYMAGYAEHLHDWCGVMMRGAKAPRTMPY
jgi:hypothetical protein